MSNLVLRLTWTQTGDYFDIHAENPDFGSWFVEESKSLGHSFHYNEASLGIENTILELKNIIDEINPYLKKFKFPEIPLLDNMYDQHNLNTVHKAWIKVLRKEPELDLLLHHIDPTLQKKFHDINNIVHEIEGQFKYKLTENAKRRLQNKFKHIAPPVGVYNVALNYCDWGKSSWDKFLNGDETPDDYELSNWETIGQYVTINLCNPYKFNMPAEYMNYCADHKIAPTVESWPLGNLIDYNDRMPVARNILNKNIQIANNSLTFSLV